MELGDSLLGGPQQKPSGPCGAMDMAVPKAPLEGACGTEVGLYGSHTPSP